MERYGKVSIVFLWLPNILFVYMGYVGIEKMVRYGSPPFYQGHSMFLIVYSFYVVPDRVILFWHSSPGHMVIWLGCIILPLAAAYILFAREKFLPGLLMLLLSIIPFGVVGFLIWLHAFLDLPHEW